MSKPITQVHKSPKDPQGPINILRINDYDFSRELYAQLLLKYKNDANAISAINEVLEASAKSTRVIFDSEIIRLIQNFLFYNKNNQTDKYVQDFYLKLYPELQQANSQDQISNDIVKKFIDRLLYCRELGLPSKDIVQGINSQLQHKMRNKLVPTDALLSNEEQDIAIFLQASSYIFNEGNSGKKELVITSVGSRFNFDGILIINNNFQSSSKIKAYWNEFFGLENNNIQSAEDFQRIFEEDQTNNEYPRYIRISSDSKVKGAYGKTS